MKQYGSDKLARTRGDNEGVERFWRSTFAWQAVVRFYRPAASLGLNERAQLNIKSLRMVTDQFNLANIKTHQEVCHLFIRRNANEAYLLAEEGKVYSVFFTSSGREVELDVSGLKGKVMVRWLNPGKAEWLEEQSVYGEKIILTKPGEGQWVAELKKAG